ncbi:flagellar hook-associated protein 2 [Desulfurella multipotens]|uniref:Flagellar hook-associated protein 2 n=1 Tax=Desulfurella multipotens TaxID=79269 RepID=A0A1G6NH15_9BACT|nr:flagellar filament capping protein FliD [Desulfurella multipotens]SDC66596.1 flagellar hook-associated protein 2 [Desulfurella multipotens]
MSMQVGSNYILGLGNTSNLNLQSMLQQLVTAQSQPIINLQAQQTQQKAYLQTFSNFSSQLIQLQTSANNIIQDLTQQTATSSNTSVATVSNNQTTASGIHTLSVTQLAKAQVWVSSNGFSSPNSQAATSNGVFSFSIGSQSYSVTVNTSTTLQSLANAINATNSGLSASIVYNGSSYNLVLTTPTGTQNNLTINTNNTLAVFGSTPTQNSQDAQATLDGVSITSQSNDLKNYIQGVDIQLQGTGTTTITLNYNTSQLTQDMQTFVNNYNNLLQYVNQNNSYDSTTNIAGAFFGSTAIQSVMASLRNAFFGLFNQNTNQTINSAESIGFSFDRNGNLQFNSLTFQQALSTNFNAVKNILTNSSANGIMDLINNAVNQATSVNGGAITTAQNIIQNQINSLQSQINTLKQNLQNYQNNLVVQFSQLNTIMNQMQAQSQYLTTMFDSLTGTKSG